MPTKGYYSIIQFCPDASRAEAANIGVLLFCPENGYLDAKTSDGNDRIARFFGRSSFDPKRINDAKKAIVSRIQTERQRFRTLEDLSHLVETRGNDVTLTPARAVRVVNPASDLERLFDELIGVRHSRERDRGSELLPRLRQVFNRPALKEKILRDERVIIPITRDILEAPYAFYNGALNLVRPLTMTTRTLAEARRLAIDGDLLIKHAAEMPQPATLLVALATPVSSQQREQRDIAEELFHEYSLQTYREEALDDLARYVEDVVH